MKRDFHSEGKDCLHFRNELLVLTGCRTVLFFSLDFNQFLLLFLILIFSHYFIQYHVALWSFYSWVEGILSWQFISINTDINDTVAQRERRHCPPGLKDRLLILIVLQ